MCKADCSPIWCCPWHEKIVCERLTEFGLPNSVIRTLRGEIAGYSLFVVVGYLLGLGVAFGRLFQILLRRCVIRAVFSIFRRFFYYLTRFFISVGLL